MNRVSFSSTGRLAAALVCGALAVVATVPAQAQAKPQTAAPKLKGVWEPVNYTEDLRLTDVFFVTADIGYVAGAGATILKTTDAGATWTALMGGDPESAEREVSKLFFVSPTTGWAVQISGKANLFRTTDGERWQRVAQINEHYDDIAFWTATAGLYVDDDQVFRTRDGGRTWTPVYRCTVKLEVDGLTRSDRCFLSNLSLAGANVAYASGSGAGVARGVVAKTTDGGATWQVLATPYEGPAKGDRNDIAFVDENVGYVRFGDADTGELFQTRDGGATWTGVTGSPGRNMAFTDPDVAWCMHYQKLSYTTDGGNRWSSRLFTFPAQPAAFSLPRRDRAYVVGDHGMIYRYSVLPEAAPVAARAIAAPAMPVLDSAVLSKVAALDAGIDKLESFVAAAGGATEAESGSEAAEPQPLEAAVLQQVSQLQGHIDALAAGAPEMGRKYRNLNMLGFGLQLLNELTGQGAGLKEAFSSLREARDLGSLSQGLGSLQGQLEAMKTSLENFKAARRGGS